MTEAVFSGMRRGGSRHGDSNAQGLSSFLAFGYSVSQKVVGPGLFSAMTGAANSRPGLGGYTAGSHNQTLIETVGS